MSALRAVRAKKLPLRSLKSQRKRVRRAVKVKKQPVPLSRYQNEWRMGSDQGMEKVGHMAFTWDAAKA